MSLESKTIQELINEKSWQGVIASSCVASMVKNGMNLSDVLEQIKENAETQVIAYKDNLATPD